jgi:hypothetical protein
MALRVGALQTPQARPVSRELVFARSPAGAAHLQGGRSMPHQPDPPASPILRSADEAALQDVERRIRHRLVRHVATCAAKREPPAPGLDLPRSPALDLYVDRYLRELWSELPEDLRNEHARAVARLDAAPPVGGGEQPTGPEARADTVPREMLTGWHAITNALDMRYNQRDDIKSLNRRCQGPIVNRGAGTRPMVYRDDLLDWWNRLAVQHQELNNRREGARLSAEARHNYGHEGIAAPEIGGGVKKRRKDRRT